MADDLDIDDYISVPRFLKRTGFKATFVYERLRRGLWDGFKAGDSDKTWAIHKHAHHPGHRKP